MEVNGWKLYQHPVFKEPFEQLVAEVFLIKKKNPRDFASNDKVKLLKRILEVILEEIPRDPNHIDFHQGRTLGDTHKHWRRAKFLKRFRLFFRFQSKSKIIIYSWVNDENILRKAGGRTDPYVIFGKKLRTGNPPTDWSDLLKDSEEIELIWQTKFHHTNSTILAIC